MIYRCIVFRAADLLIKNELPGLLAVNMLTFREAHLKANQDYYEHAVRISHAWKNATQGDDMLHVMLIGTQLHCLTVLPEVLIFVVVAEP